MSTIKLNFSTISTYKKVAYVLCVKLWYNQINPRLCGATPFVREGGMENSFRAPFDTKGVPPAGGGGCDTMCGEKDFSSFRA